MLKSSTIYVRQYALNTLLKSRTSQIDLSLTLFSFWFLMFLMFWIVLVFKQIYEFGDSLDLKFWVQQYSNPSSHSVFPKTPKTLDCHYVKSVHILSYSGPHFPAFGLNTDRYYVSIRIQSDCWETADQNNSEYRHFSRSVYVLSGGLERQNRLRCVIFL